MKYIIDNKYGKTNFASSIAYYLKIVCNRVFYSFLVILSILILILQKKNFHFINNTKQLIIFFSKPEILIVNGIDSIIDRLNYTIGFFSQINRNNKILKKENLNLKIKLLKLNILEDENKELKNILNFVSKNYITKYTIKKINILNKNSFINRAEIEIKNNDNISENDLVIDNYGNLVGRVINIKDNYAEILLITDNISKFPAKLENSKVKVLLEGDESKTLKINFFLGEKFNIKENENVFTSSDGDVIQEGIRIGKVVKNKNGDFKVKINTVLCKINYVVILHNK